MFNTSMAILSSSEVINPCAPADLIRNLSDIRFPTLGSVTSSMRVLKFAMVCSVDTVGFGGPPTLLVDLISAAKVLNVLLLIFRIPVSGSASWRANSCDIDGSFPVE